MNTPPLLHFIIPHGGAPAVLVLPAGEAWTLPAISTENWQQRPNIYSAFEDGMGAVTVTGLATTTLYSPLYLPEADGEPGRFVFVAERLGDEPLPDGARWLTGAEVDTVPLAHAHLRPVLAHWFHEQVTGSVPPERPPWGAPGWLTRAQTWITEQVAADGAVLTGDITLVRKWCITCMLKAPTDRGDLYVKAVPPTFAREIAVTRLLSSRHPAHIPSIVAWDSDQRWLMLRDFGGTILGECKDPDVWARAVRDFAALQIDMAGQTDALLAAGAMDYRLDSIHARLDAMLADEAFMHNDDRFGADSVARLRQLAPRIHTMLDELDAIGLPQSIIHGDFHVYNVAAREQHTIFFDWTDAGVGHLFYDMMPFFRTMLNWVFPDQPEIVTGARSAYLDALSVLAPRDVLEPVLALGETLGYVHHAANYHALLQGIEPSEQWILRHTWWMFKELLERLEAA